MVTGCQLTVAQQQGREGAQHRGRLTGEVLLGDRRLALGRDPGKDQIKGNSSARRETIAARARNALPSGTGEGEQGTEGGKTE